MQYPAKMRESVITETTGEKLTQYLTFRHFFRHAYGFQMDWDKMKHLISGINPVWESVQKDIEKFIAN
jgi:uncharacterized protein YutE (UPF0331/DUF86 family)